MNLASRKKHGAFSKIVKAELELKNSGRSTYLSHQLTPHPFHITVPFNYEGDPPDLVTLYMQSSSGGLYDKDCQELDVTLFRGSKLHLTSQASTIVHHARDEVGAKCIFNFNLSDDTTFEYLPDPVILMAGCKFSAISTINLKPNCQAIMSEAFITHDPSNSGQIFDNCYSETQIFLDSELVVNEKFNVSGADYFSRIDGYSCFASIYLYGYSFAVIRKIKDALAELPEAYSGCSYFKENKLAIFKVLAQRSSSLLRITESTWALAREDMTGQVPKRRRK